MSEIEQLVEVFNNYRDDEIATHMSAYMRNLWPFIGLKSPVRNELQKPLISAYKKADFSDISVVIKKLWDLPEREFQYVACDLLRANSKKIPIDYIEDMECLITTKSWWDSVDSIAPSSVGVYFYKFPNQIDLYINRWIDSENIWLNRSAILFQLKYKMQTDTELLKYIIQKLNGSKEFFVNKAIGWSLREYSKVNPEWVSNFLASNQLSKLSEKEALKIIIKTNKL